MCYSRRVGTLATACIWATEEDGSVVEWEKLKKFVCFASVYRTGIFEFWLGLKSDSATVEYDVLMLKVLNKNLLISDFPVTKSSISTFSLWKAVNMKIIFGSRMKAVENEMVCH